MKKTLTVVAALMLILCYSTNVDRAESLIDEAPTVALAAELDVPSEQTLPSAEEVVVEEVEVEEPVKEQEVLILSAAPKKEYLTSFVANVTAYTLYPSETGGKNPGDSGYGKTASGVRVQSNHTIAAYRDLPFGTKVHIEGFDDIVFTVEDRGGAIKKGHIDIFMANRREALDFGRRQLTVHVIEWGDANEN